MSTGISALYSEFTAALTEVLAENVVDTRPSPPLERAAAPSRFCINLLTVARARGRPFFDCLSLESHSPARNSVL